MYYRQCQMTNGLLHLTSWIPEKYAVVGKVLRLRDEETKTWSKGWTVTGASASRLHQDQLGDARLPERK